MLSSDQRSHNFHLYNSITWFDSSSCVGIYLETGKIIWTLFLFDNLSLPNNILSGIFLWVFPSPRFMKKIWLYFNIQVTRKEKRRKENSIYFLGCNGLLFLGGHLWQCVCLLSSHLYSCGFRRGEIRQQQQQQQLITDRVASMLNRMLPLLVFRLLGSCCKYSEASTVWKVLKNTKMPF